MHSNLFEVFFLKEVFVTERRNFKIAHHDLELLGHHHLKLMYNKCCEIMVFPLVLTERSFV